MQMLILSDNRIISSEYKTRLVYSIITVRHRLFNLIHIMKSFVAILALVAVAAADVSHILSADSQASIVAQDADVFPDKFQYHYETSNGISGQESGALKNVGREDEALEVSGANSYTDPSGQVVSIKYVANEFGYQPEGSHIPTPVPIPEYIARALAYIETHAPKVAPQ